MNIELTPIELLIGIHGCASFPYTSPGLWGRLVDSFNNMSVEERMHLFHSSVIDFWYLFNGPTRDGEAQYDRDDFNMFVSKFNPYNKYNITVSNDGSTKVFECFWFDGNFYTGFNRFINNEYIKNVEWSGKEDSDLYEDKYGQTRYKIDERVGLKPPYEI